ncbi:MAG: RagB/SusD family nutrient uptake outer membrane protein [Muribaculaceae bacterium]|nr:RagB/SusD family nutrient uptake outer membrane protein [Muribaculaceae bacterium]
MNAAAGVAMLASVSACSSDYLDTAPQNKPGSETIFASTENAAMAINGICLAMMQQYGVGTTSSSGTQGMNGEGTLMTWFNEYTGVDYQKSNLTGWQNTCNCVNITSGKNTYVKYPWHYLYKQISNANSIIANIDGAEGTQAERDFIKAQALTFRAYFYGALVKYYSRRWSDANGLSRGVILRLEPTNEPMEASSLKAVYAQIYQDLDDAIALYKSSGMNRPKGDLWSPNEDVAHAVYARYALNREDWQTAYEQAQLARKGYKLMTADDYKAGFNAPTSEWIWEGYNDAGQTIHHYGFFSYNGSNTDTSAGYKYVPSISKTLIDRIPEDDARRWCYLVPLESEKGSYKETDSGSAVKKGALEKRARGDYGAYLNGTSTVIFAYMSFKFRSASGHSDGCISLFRAAEMYYTQAEAAWHIGGKDAEIQKLLEEAVAPYQKKYKCDKTGDELLEEVKLYRRFDLWGEGFSWYDQKRWGNYHVRLTFDEGGNFAPAFCGTGTSGGNYGPEDRNNWTYVYPIQETDNNPLVTAEEPKNKDWSN